jgi:lysophospholipase L1-like esterase
MRLPIFLVILLATVSQLRAGENAVACVGDSITYGYLVPKGWDYPSQLGRMLNTENPYVVINLGVNGATLLRAGDRPYEKQPAFKALMRGGYAEVIIMLGANDTKAWNWGPHQGDFEADYRWLISQVVSRSSPGEPTEIFLCRPCWVSGTNKFGITEEGIEKEIPIIDKIAADLHLKEIDMHAVLEGHPEDFRDTVHPTAAGDTLLAKAVFKEITGHDFQGAVPAPTPSSTASPAP